MNMNITVKHIEELLTSRKGNYRVVLQDGKFIITAIYDYDNKQSKYELIKLLHEHHNPENSLREYLVKFIPEDLFVITRDEINIPYQKIHVDYSFSGGTFGNYHLYNQGIQLDNYSTYIDINQMP